MQLRAALIYRFATLTEWPPRSFDGDESPVHIAFAGNSALEDSVRRFVEGKKIGTRPIHVVRLEDLGEGVVPHVLVLSDVSEAHVSERLALFQSKPVLTIGDGSGFIRAGGIVHLRRDGSKLAFAVNIQALRRVENSGLRLNPQVLKLGKIVDQGGDAP